MSYSLHMSPPKNQLPNFHELLSRSDCFGEKTNSIGVIKTNSRKHPNCEALKNWVKKSVWRLWKISEISEFAKTCGEQPTTMYIFFKKYENS